MNAISLKHLIRQGEGTEIEFKKTLTHLPKIAKTLTAFANNRGGHIIVGVQDNRAIVGVNPDEESFMVMQAARDWCFPPINLALHEQECDGATLLVIEVPESGKKPHQARDKGNEWHTYVRADDKCLVADRQQERLLQRQPPAEERGQRTLTRHEQSIFSYIALQKRITIKDLARLINTSRNRASKMLLELCREGLLFEHTQGGNLFYLKA